MRLVRPDAPDAHFVVADVCYYFGSRKQIADYHCRQLKEFEIEKYKETYREYNYRSQILELRPKSVKLNIGIRSPLLRIDLIAKSYFSIEDILTEDTWETFRHIGFFD